MFCLVLPPHEKSPAVPAEGIVDGRGGSLGSRRRQDMVTMAEGMQILNELLWDLGMSLSEKPTCGETVTKPQ